MSTGHRHAPIDEKWLDRPRAKRKSDEASSNNKHNPILLVNEEEDNRKKVEEKEQVSIIRKKTRMPDIDDDIIILSPPSKRKRVVQDTNATVISPIVPTLNPCDDLDTANDARLSWVLYLAIQEEGSFVDCIQQCNSISKTTSKEFQERLQMDGTRHITLWEGKMTKRQASKMELTNDDTSLPIPVTFSGYQPWKAGVYLKVHPTTQQRLKESIMKKLTNLSGGKIKCDHLSLYRCRGMNAKVFATGVKAIKDGIHGSNWGTVQGVSVRLKVVGSDYSHCRVLLAAGE
mmetsp:Transcript_37214/g.90394  ORF Transcript_37214/g.90394 Transcript_37214/m.90394 type:complete len:288 (+) Transcript_37214:106-969(+)